EAERRAAEERSAAEGRRREREEADRAAAAEASRKEREELLKVANLQFERASRLQLEEQRAGMQRANGESLKAALDPLMRELDVFRKAFADNRDEQIRNKASFERTVESLESKVTGLGRSAESLSKALRSESKMQGNWGETVLGNILEESGLRRGHDFEVQAATRDEAGNELIPDVVVHLPGNGRIVVDSKVSLTAWAAAADAQDPAARARCIAQHVESLRRHVTELADKNYGGRIKGVPGWVMMFVPNEGGYLAALEANPKLLDEAYRRHVLVVCPSTLLLSLHIVKNLWNGAELDERARRIQDAAAKIYEKFSGFAANFLGIEAHLEKAAEAWNEAHGQLLDGKGNILRQLENFKKFGVVTTKKIPGALLPPDDHPDGPELPAGVSPTQSPDA
ncbi:MAG: DNA recombination protein RmuC, partial [Kiritimatiellae bacterium]|nr:DNA recombination protein RmuC [Kiritimatiellia bacterium]